jgi:beta-phosphoglucomutase family hydrolase
MPRAFIFDMDGTMVDNMHHHTQSWVSLLEKRGVQIDPAAFFKDTAGRPGEVILRSYLSATLSDADCAALIEEKEALYRQLYSPHLKLLPGFDRFLQEAQAQGVRLAVATGAPPQNIAFTLDGLGLRDVFHAVVGAADVQRGKPDPQVFELAAQRCGVAAHDCVVFEDAPLGVEAAGRAGMPAVVLTTTLPSAAFSHFLHVRACAADFSGWTCAGLLQQ